MNTTCHWWMEGVRGDCEGGGGVGKNRVGGEVRRGCGVNSNA